MSDLLQYTLHLADNALILGHRNSEWTGHGPVLEQDIAISNIALDLIGQARNFYQYAATLQGEGATEDTIAYMRDVMAFNNCLLAELPRGDWAQTILRQYLFSTYQFYLYQQLQRSTNATIAGVAEKALKEAAYHVRWSGEWVIRLGDGTAESHTRIENALTDLWPYTGELTTPAAYELVLVGAGIAANPESFRDRWTTAVNSVLEEATWQGPKGTGRHGGGKGGVHSEHLGYILAEMQYLQKTYPGCEW